MSKIRVLLSCQSAEQRNQIENVFKDIPDMEVVGSTPSGKIALKKIAEYQPDVIIVSKFLGDMDASEFTSLAIGNHDKGIFILNDENPDDETVSTIIKALDKGAIDFISYTWENDEDKNRYTIVSKLLPKIRAFTIKKFSLAAQTLSSSNTKVNRPTKLISQNKSSHIHSSKYKIVLIGASTGGPEALENLVPQFKKDFPLPIVIVLHMPAEYTGTMAAALNRKSSLNITEAKSGDVIKSGNVYLAPGGLHLIIKKKGDGSYYLKTNKDSLVHGCRPSVDVLFSSAAKIFTFDAIAVMLTGMGVDGTEGMKELYEKGAYCIAQDEKSSVVWGMPGSVVEKNITNIILPLDLIADKLIRLSNV